MVVARSWEQTARKLISTPHHAARFDLTRVVASGSKTTAKAVDYPLWPLLRMPTANPTRDATAFLTSYSTENE